MAKLVEFTGHQDVMVKRYVQETVRDAAGQLHAPRELMSAGVMGAGIMGAGLLAWLARVGLARGVAIDCEAVLREAAEPGLPRRRNPSALVRLARDIHQWKGEIVDGRSRHSRDH
jgi:hypothetical protein